MFFNFPKWAQTKWWFTKRIGIAVRTTIEDHFQSDGLVYITYLILMPFLFMECRVCFCTGLCIVTRESNELSMMYLQYLLLLITKWWVSTKISETLMNLFVNCKFQIQTRGPFYKWSSKFCFWAHCCDEIISASLRILKCGQFIVTLSNVPNEQINR